MSLHWHQNLMLHECSAAVGLVCHGQCVCMTVLARGPQALANTLHEHFLQMTFQVSRKVILCQLTDSFVQIENLSTYMMSLYSILMKCSIRNIHVGWFLKVVVKGMFVEWVRLTTLTIVTAFWLSLHHVKRVFQTKMVIILSVYLQVPNQNGH